MLGGSLLVAPVFREDGQVTFYLPDRRWTNFLTNEVLQSGWHKAQYNFMGLPLFVRENTLLAQMTAEVAIYDLSGGVTLDLYHLVDGMTRRRPYRALRAARGSRYVSSGTAGGWSLRQPVRCPGNCCFSEPNCRALCRKGTKLRCGAFCCRAAMGSRQRYLERLPI